MNNFKSRLKYAGYGLLTALLLAGWPGGSGLAAPPDDPITLRDQGSFYIGGEKIFSLFPGVQPSLAQPGHIIVNQMYVEFQIPLIQKHLPIVLVHGGSLSGSNWDTTPDGREGWKTKFLRNGFPVYIVDHAGQGRSSFDPTRLNQAVTENDALLLPRAGAPKWPLESAWLLFRFGPAPGVAHPTQQFPLEAVDQLLAQSVPATATFNSNPDPSHATARALAALFDKIGPAVILGFSAGGSPTIAAAIARPQLAAATVVLEPVGGCAASDSDIVSSLTKMPFLALWGDFVVTDPLWGAIHARCQITVDKANLAGGKAENVLLPDEGFQGNTHMFMQDKNNAEIGDWLIKWIKHNVPYKTK